MAIEAIVTPDNLGHFPSGDNAITVIQIASRHVIAIRHQDAVSVHITGEDAKRLQGIILRSKSLAKVDYEAVFFAIDTLFIQEALKKLGFVGVGLIRVA